MGTCRRRPEQSALKEWGDQHLNAGTEPIVFEHICGAESQPQTVCEACGEELRDGQLIVIGGTHPVEATM